MGRQSCINTTIECWNNSANIAWDYIGRNVITLSNPLDHSRQNKWVFIYCEQFVINCARFSHQQHLLWLQTFVSDCLHRISAQNNKLNGCNFTHARRSRPGLTLEVSFSCGMRLRLLHIVRLHRCLVWRHGSVLLSSDPDSTDLTKNSRHFMMEGSSKLNCAFCDNSDIRNLFIFIESTDSFHNEFVYYEVRGTRGVLHRNSEVWQSCLAITSSPRSSSWREDCGRLWMLLTSAVQTPWVAM